jgi:PDZ domain-containing secreted protein
MEFTDVELTDGTEIAATGSVEKAGWVHAL